MSIHGGFTADVDKVNQLAVIEAGANSAKLAAADADERHLFVWLRLTHPDAELAVHTGPPPSSPPALPLGAGGIGAPNSVKWPWIAIRYDQFHLNTTGGWCFTRRCG